MIGQTTAGRCGTSVPTGVTPSPVRLPKLVHGAAFAFFRRRSMRHWINRRGHIFEINVPFFGRSVIVSDPALVGLMCTTAAEHLVNVQPNIGNLLGPGSVFALDDGPHRDRRRLLSPGFHGQCLKGYEQMIVDETLRETANWPQDREFRILEPMNRIALNVILRTLFGAEEPEFVELRQILPSFMKRGSILAFVPRPPLLAGRHSPWGPLDASRRAIDRIIFALIERAVADPTLGERRDILALLLRSRSDDGAAYRTSRSATSC